MRHYNIDVEESDRNYVPNLDDLGEELEEEDDGTCRSFFDLRQRILVGLDQSSSFRLVALAVVRKLQNNLKGSVLYSEVEDALNRYCRLLEADMQKFATLHKTLQEAAEKEEPGTSSSCTAMVAARAILADGMREIAVVLLACGEMQRKALDLKMSAQRSIADSFEDAPPLVSFSKFAEFLEEALAVSDQLRRKHEELQQQRMRAMASVAEARMSARRQVGQTSQPLQPARSASPRRSSTASAKGEAAEKGMHSARSTS